MNGYGLAAVVVVCVTVVIVVLLWAMVRAGQRAGSVSAAESVVSGGERPEASQRDSEERQAALRKGIEAAAERARREGRGQW
ncbi:hypothetical protein [Streptomyces sp. NPDC127038]|uniref:hypothetical protein n=1 Tax=Streptomyces sp. NPDC127038 TaxID=3347114 RepID=UPI003662A5D7